MTVYASHSTVTSHTAKSTTAANAKCSLAAKDLGSRVGDGSFLAAPKHRGRDGGPRSEGSTIAFVSACEQAALQEGQIGLFRVGKRSILLVWPRGGEVRAYHGRCPHQDIPLDNATFDGKTIVCGHHQWQMDGTTGACVNRVVTHKCALAPYAMRFEGAQVQVDLP